MKKILLLLLLLPLFTSAQTITTFAGCGNGDDSMAIHSELSNPFDVASDAAGNIYIADYGSYRIRKVSTSGVITTIAGTGVFGYSGDGGPAVNAMISGVFGIAVDKAGNVYISDLYNYRVRKISAAGIITTVAGTGTLGHSGDGGAATSALLKPYGLAIDTMDNVYVSDSDNIRKINVTTGMINTVAGVGMQGFSGDGGPATAAALYDPYRIAIDRNNNLYIGDGGNFRVREVNAAGIITTIAGDGSYGYSGDGSFAVAASLGFTFGITTDTSGNVYIGDAWYQHIRKINMTTGFITNVAGNGTAGYSGDGSNGTLATMSTPCGLTSDHSGNIYFADQYNNRIRQVDLATGIITTAAGQSGMFDQGYNAINAEINTPDNVAVDTAGNVYFPDIYNQRICKVSTSGIITTVAGSGVSGYYDAFSGDGGAATAAHLFNPAAVAVDAAGDIYIADQSNQRIRKVDASGIITTYAGNGTAGYFNGASATASLLNYPSGVAVDTAGNLYISDASNYRIRKVTPAGAISTVAGDGFAGYSGDGGSAVLARIMPIDVATDTKGNIYIADGGNNRVRKVDAAGIITTVAGNGTAGSGGDGGPATAAEINGTGGVKVDAAGNVYLTDGSNRIRMVDTAGIMHTIAGNGTAGFSGDGGPATAAEINGPAGVAIDAAGNIYIADANNYRVRKISNNLSVPNVAAAAGSIVVYPNPAGAVLNILSTNEPIGEVSIFNMLGQSLQSAVCSGQLRVTVDISSLPAGVYFVRLSFGSAQDDSHSEVRKFVKE